MDCLAFWGWTPLRVEAPPGIAAEGKGEGGVIAVGDLPLRLRRPRPSLGLVLCRIVSVWSFVPGLVATVVLAAAIQRSCVTMGTALFLTVSLLCVMS